MKLGTVKQEVIEEWNFSLSDHLQRTKFLKSFLHLMTRKKSSQTLVLEEYANASYIDISDDENTEPQTSAYNLQETVLTGNETQENTVATQQHNKESLFIWSNGERLKQC